MMDLPLFQGGLNWSRMRAAKKSFQQARHQTTALEERIREEVRTSWVELKSLEKVKATWERALNLERAALDGIKEQVKQEIVPLREELKSQEDLVQKEIEYQGVLFQMAVERFRLLRVLGLLSVESLGLI